MHYSARRCHKTRCMAERRGQTYFCNQKHVMSFWATYLCAMVLSSLHVAHLVWYMPDSSWDTAAMSNWIWKCTAHMHSIASAKHLNSVAKLALLGMLFAAIWQFTFTSICLLCLQYTMTVVSQAYVSLLHFCMQAGLSVESCTRFHFGTTYVIKARPA